MFNKASAFLDLPGDFQVQDTEEIVFEGLARTQLEDGLWIRLDDSGLTLTNVASDLPIKEIDGRKFIRVIQTSELVFLADELREDSFVLPETL